MARLDGFMWNLDQSRYAATAISAAAVHGSIIKVISLGNVFILVDYIRGFFVIMD